MDVTRPDGPRSMAEVTRLAAFFLFKTMFAGLLYSVR